MVIAIALFVLTLAILFSAWFYYKRTKRLLHRILDMNFDMFNRIENRLVYGLPDWKENPNGKKVWALVFTYNRKAFLERALEMLRKHEPDLPILVIDNGSNDGTPELLCDFLAKSGINKFLLNRNQEVPQWQKSFDINQALRLLALEQPDYLVWMDDDVEVERPFVEIAIALLDRLKNERVKLISMTDDEREEKNHATIKEMEVEFPMGTEKVKIRSSFNGQLNFFASGFFREFGPPPIGEGIRDFAGEDWYYSRRLKAVDCRVAVFVAATNVGYGRSKREEIDAQNKGNS